MGTHLTLREQIADTLREKIIEGELKPGSRLQEVEIASQYQTSRTPVREAFHQLESEGFLNIKARRGAYVAPITETDILEFYELKSLLEAFAAKRAVKNLSEEDIERMEQLCNLLWSCFKSSDFNGILQLNTEFHEIFVEACGNKRLSSLIKALGKQFQRFRIALSHTEAVEDGIKLQEQIVKAFKSRDADQVSNLVRENSTQGSEALLSRLKKSP